MLLKEIVAGVNRYLAGELLSYRQLLPHLDKTIDAINARLSATYPVFSELPDGTLVYELFPNRHIREIVIPGAAYFYFITDEEGEETARTYGAMFQEGLFLMERDYLMSVPPEYQASTNNGTVPFNLTGAVESRNQFITNPLQSFFTGGF